MEINFDEFKSKFWSPEQGQEATVVFGVPGRQEDREYEGKTLPRMVFDVFKVDNLEFLPPKQFVSQSGSFAEQIETIQEAALKRGEKTVEVKLLYNMKKRHLLADMHVVGEAVRGR